MSAFLVEDKTISEPVNYLGAARGAHYEHIRETLRDETGCDITTGIGRAKLASAMHDLNREAIGQRYSEDDEMLSGEPFLHKGGSRSAPSLKEAAQAYKSLRCWLYQCAEGDVPERLLFATMECVAQALAVAIVGDLPEYKTADWG